LAVTLENDFKISALYAMSFFGSISDSRDTIDFSVIKQVHTSNLGTIFCNPLCHSFRIVAEIYIVGNGIEVVEWVFGAALK